MTQEHLITPPGELVQEWVAQMISPDEGNLALDFDWLANQAARWGADMELEACCSWAEATGWYGAGDTLRDVRRSKPLSLKELNLKHLEVMERDGHYLPEIISDLRLAIESLPE